MADERVFGKYRLLRKLATGGMGEVFLAKQLGPEGFEKLLVIKRILSHHTDNSDYIDMFFAEARIAAKMSHSNIVQIFEMGDIDGAYYIAMEFVSGKSFKDIIDAAKAKGLTIPPMHIADLVARLCAGLSYAHNLTDMAGTPLGIIHRDINPHNVLVSYSGEVKIIDFGIAKSEMNEHKTETGTIKGKFVYMSPEQSAAEKVDKRSDIFSVGIVLYELLTGSNPFQKNTIMASLDAIQRYNPLPPSALDDVLAPFDDIATRALQKKADDRYQDCTDMYDDLQRLMASGELMPAPQSLGQFMTELFREQIEKEQRLLVDNDRAPVFSEAPTRTRSLPGQARGPTQDHGQNHGQLRKTAEIASAPPPRARRWWMGGVGVVCAAAGAWFIGRRVVPPREVPKPPVVEVQTDARLTTLPPPEGNLPPPQLPPPVDEPVALKNTPPSTLAPHEGDKRAHKDPEKKSGPAKTRGKDGDADDGARDEKKAPDEGAGHRAQTGDATPRAGENIASGYFLINTTPQAEIFRDGQSLGSTGTIKIEVKKGAGTIKVGDTTSPFQLSFQYRVNTQRAVELNISSEPWAILKKNNISLGRTPRPGVPAGDSAQRFEFLSPDRPGSMIVVLRYFPG